MTTLKIVVSEDPIASNVTARVIQTKIVPQGPPGPQGPTGAATSSYIHDQAIPAAQWTVNHNLGMFPAVTVVDSALTMVDGFDLEYLSGNQVRLTFSSAFAGKAYFS